MQNLKENPSTNVKFRTDVLREIDLMYELGRNSHILHLIGHIYVDNNPLLVLEYCVNGDLLSFLREALRDHKEAVFSVALLMFLILW